MRVIIFLGVVLCIFISDIGAARLMPDYSWTSGGKKYFDFGYIQPMSFTDAKESCEYYGTQLYEPRSQQDVKSLISKGFAGTFWINAQYNDTWRWVSDGSVIDNMHWFQKESHPKCGTKCSGWKLGMFNGIDNRDEWVTVEPEKRMRVLCQKDR
ncbi:hypothetical protein HDE_03549 [Halotydeus destructor]|nr:hypothetical protein HDE_03549 [Halotydeus destructor]